MKSFLIYNMIALLFVSSPAVIAQQNDEHPPIVISSSGEVTGDLLAAAQNSADITSKGDIYLTKGNFQAAEETFRTAIEVAKSSATGINPAANRGLAEALAGEGKTIEAEKIYRNLVNQDPFKWSSIAQENRTLMGFAILLSKSGKWAEATSVYKNAVAKANFKDAPNFDMNFDPQTPMPLLLQAIAHTLIGVDYLGHADYTAAFAEFNKGVRLQPENPLVNYYYGSSWQNLSPAERIKFGTAQQAKASLQKAVKSGNSIVKSDAEKALKAAG